MEDTIDHLSEFEIIGLSAFVGTVATLISNFFWHQFQKILFRIRTRKTIRILFKKIVLPTIDSVRKELPITEAFIINYGSKMPMLGMWPIFNPRVLLDYKTEELVSVFHSDNIHRLMNIIGFLDNVQHRIPHKVVHNMIDDVVDHIRFHLNETRDEMPKYSDHERDCTTVHAIRAGAVGRLNDTAIILDRLETQTKDFLDMIYLHQRIIYFIKDKSTSLYKKLTS